MASNKKATNETIGNIDLGFSTNKKKFSVNGDTSKIIEFDPSDFGVANRLSKAMPDFKKINACWEEINGVAKNMDDVDNLDDAISVTDDLSKKIDELEAEVKKLIDFAFDGEVADKLLGNSSAFSPVNGKFKYEHIIEAMLNCYEKHIKDEAPKFNARKIQKYTNKYIGK